METIPEINDDVKSEQGKKGDFLITPQKPKEVSQKDKTP
jgi:hypothetical protein